MMTIQERRDQRAEWIKTIDVGDEVCVTNIFNAPCISHTSINENLRVCELGEVRAILRDNSIVVGSTIYKPDGTPEDEDEEVLTELFPIDDDIREYVWRQRFYDDIRVVNWETISSGGIVKIIEIINDEIKKIEEARKAEEEKRAAEAKEKYDAGVLSLKDNSALITHNVSSDIDRLADEVAKKLKMTQTEEGDDDNGIES